MENEKLFDLMTQMYSEMKDGFKTVNERLDKVEKTVLNIEQDHGKKIEALFDAATQHTAQLTRIEEEVKRQDEIILRKVK